MMEKMDNNYDAVLWRLRELEENSKCADCTDSFPRYMNTTYGTFVCSQCGSIHKELGNKVKSLSADTFSQQDIDKLEKVGNKMASEIWLSKWNQQQYPLPSSNDEKKVRDFIKLKYVEKKWLKDGVAQSEFILSPSIKSGNTPSSSFTSPKSISQQQQQQQANIPLRNSGEKKEILTSKNSLSKEFESLSLGNSNNLLNLNSNNNNNNNNNQSGSTSTTSDSAVSSSHLGSNGNTPYIQQHQQQQQYDSNGKPFNPFRDENNYFNSKPVNTSENKVSFPPFSEKPFDQHSYLTDKSNAASSLGKNSSFYSKIQLQTAAPKPPPTSIYDTQQYKQQQQLPQQQLPQQQLPQQQLPQQQNNNMNRQLNNSINNQQQYMNNSLMDNNNYGNSFPNYNINNNNNNNMQQQQQQQPPQYNPFTDTSISSNNNQLALVNSNDQSDLNNNNQMIQPYQMNNNNNMQTQQQFNQQPQMMNSGNNIQPYQQQPQPQPQQPIINNLSNSSSGNPFGNGVSEQVILQHQQMHQQNMQQQQPQQQHVPQMVMGPNGQMMMVTAPATTTTTTIIHTPIGGPSSSSSGGNPFDNQPPLDEMFGKKINSDPIFPASKASFESGNSLDRSDEDQKEAWRKIQETNIQIQNDKEIARKLQLEEEENFKTRPRSNTEPSRSSSSSSRSTQQQQQYSSYNNNNGNIQQSTSYVRESSYSSGMPISSHHSGHHRSSSSGSLGILKRLGGRSRSKSYDYDDPFEIPPSNLNKSSGGYDDYDNFMKKNKRIPGGGPSYQPKFGSQGAIEYYESNNINNNNNNSTISNDYSQYQQPEPKSQQIVVHGGGNPASKSYNECDHCGKEVGLELMSYHKNTECILRQERCTYCNKLVKHMQMGDHQLQCLTNTYTCGVCGRLVMGKEMPDHMAYLHPN